MESELFSKINLPDNLSFGRRYKTLRVLGIGATGKCYLVYDYHDRTKKVIKVFTNSTIWEELHLKSSVLESIDHPNIVRIDDISLINDLPCIVQQYITGKSIDSYPENIDLYLKDFIQIIKETLNALKYLQNLGLSHKDLKPSNIIFDSTQRKTTLVDLDYLVLGGKDTNKFYGTISYAAPEQLIQNRPSAIADCYSLGLVLCFLLVGYVPFSINFHERESNAKELIRNVLSQNQELNVFLKDSLVKLLDALLTYTHSRRIDIDSALVLTQNLEHNCISANQGDVILRKASPVTQSHRDAPTQIISLINETIVDIPLASYLLQSISLSGLYPVNWDQFDDSSFDNWINDFSSEKTKLDNATLPPQDVSSKAIPHFPKDSTPYRKLLIDEYEHILRQAKIASFLWSASAVLCFIIVIVALVQIIHGNYAGSIYTALLDCFVAGIIKLFEAQEKQYHELVAQKMKHLETGDYWEYAFEKVGEISNPQERIQAASNLIKTIADNSNSSH